ncbi:hypothetical protein GCM10010277_50830 [Streptomyces longisporoflavus]|uniref:DUF397 domain-containing protein n=1 Tax=Streptomyces longisporoflavus TaxID=28044 RepID=UPI00167D9F5F|nr:DUF397 domain-containing protein [Streptomyces longisporoflavus]GGV53267.1 hypothetical protein GCM10010277_50830 [Streptomyces longisporoflavus]
MTQNITWQKSSFSGGQDSSDCVELASAEGAIRLRESDAPNQVLTPTPESLAALIRHVRTRKS